MPPPPPPAPWLALEPSHPPAIELGQLLVQVRPRVIAALAGRLKAAAAEAGKNIGMAILSFISIITLIFYFFVKNALSVIRVSEHGK